MLILLASQKPTYDAHFRCRSGRIVLPSPFSMAIGQPYTCMAGIYLLNTWFYIIEITFGKFLMSFTPPHLRSFVSVQYAQYTATIVASIGLSNPNLRN